MTKKKQRGLKEALDQDLGQKSFDLIGTPSDNKEQLKKAFFAGSTIDSAHSNKMDDLFEQWYINNIES